MKNRQQQLEKFFAAYEQRFNDVLNDKPADVDATAAAFAEYFVESSPAGVMGGKNDEKFKEQIPKGNEFYKKIGTLSMKIGTLDITRLDDFHAIAKVHWLSSYKENKNIEFDVFYIVNLVGDEPKIFAYITGDEQKVLQENGLVPKQ
ncbi:hypothetical protein EGT74_14550 [Chitinophaga lutea]|uniref:Nuclear transport factor 2 family protein n=1 Tax=Chitinophaga lutea TaxID=2488634 RepID=A0A3N4PL47_9BACT|nr:hypothetical protein [Chitinophaga lutea]RPE08278.1 hypothetical protein EGT74_14550 [Chitinophaga lutea]